MSDECTCGEINARHCPVHGTACEHQWEWVQPRIVTIGDYTATNQGPARDTYNARCTRCGETTWAHGWNVPVPVHPGPRDPVLEQEC